MASETLSVRAGMRSRRIDVDYLARVEGEGSLLVDVVDGKLRDVQLKIFEPPRFFEALLRGRALTEAPDLTARICGICPVAYQMSAVHAMENALGMEIDEGIKRLRRLLYCGEWIESHVLHIYLLHAPDFAGLDDAVALAAADRETVLRGLRMKKAGNELVRLLGGREIHPVNVRVGGFYKIPDVSEFQKLLGELQWARDAAEETVAWTAGFEFPELSRDYEFVALRHEQDYPFCEGRIVSSKGLDISMTDYPEHFGEHQVPHSSALHSLRQPAGTPYLVGPLARYNLNRDRLSPGTRRVAAAYGFDRAVTNPFESIVVRALETYQVFDEAIALITDFPEPGSAAQPLPGVSGVGRAATEAPRGILFHEYEVDEQGMIRHADIVPPTSQNQTTIEDDLRELVAANLALDDESLTWRCEQAIRNYDPCISCATHFLKLERRDDRSS